MKRVYPFIPKSNVNLLPGDFWSIQLPNGQFCVSIILDIPHKELKDRTNIYIGLLDRLGNSEVDTQDLILYKPKLLQCGESHFKTITEYGYSIIGHVNLEEINIKIPFEVSSAYYSEESNILQGFKEIRKSIPEDHKRYPARSVFGYKYIYLLAEELIMDNHK